MLPVEAVWLKGGVSQEVREEILERAEPFWAAEFDSNYF